MRGIWVRVGTAVALVAALGLVGCAGPSDMTGVPEFAKGGGETTTGHNLSYPVVFIGAPISLRGTMGQYAFGGAFWYGWETDSVTESGTVVVQKSCDPALEGCPPVEDGVIVRNLSKIWLQKDAINTWQAGHLDGVGTATADFLDWSDNLESVYWTATSVVRVEAIPFATLATPLTEFAMWWAWGKGTDEMWGARGTLETTDDPPIASLPYYKSGAYATINMPNACMSFTKLAAGEGAVDDPPDGPFTWSYDGTGCDGVWTGVSQTVNETLGGELNIGGKIIFGYNWNLKRVVMVAGVAKAGWWRLTFYTPYVTGTTPAIGFAETTQGCPPWAAPCPTQVIVAAEEGGDTGPVASPVIDVPNQLTYIDVFILPGKGGGKRQ